jgi:hypothetical protein
VAGMPRNSASTPIRVTIIADEAPRPDLGGALECRSRSKPPWDPEVKRRIAALARSSRPSNTGVSSGASSIEES